MKQPTAINRILILCSIITAILLLQIIFSVPTAAQERLEFGEHFFNYKVCKAIAWHETKMCTIGTGKTKNNCVGIRRGGAFVVYPSPKESIDDCMQVWAKNYTGVPTIEKAKKWSGNDRAEVWLYNVLAYMDNKTL